MASLNPKRDYAEIFGHHHGAAYSQGGLYFDVDGELILDHPDYDEHLKAKAEKLDRTGKFEADEADEEYQERVQETKRRKAQEDGTLGSKIDFKAWAMGEKSYVFPEVRAALKKVYSFNAVNKQAAITFLVDQKVVKPSDLKR